MARIPVYESGVRTDPLANKRASAFITPAAAGAGFSEAISRLGNGLADVAEAMDYKDQITAKADSDNAYNQYMEHRRQVLYDPETGYLNQSGSNALGGSREAALDELQKRRAAVEAGLSPRALADFKKRADGVDNTVKDNAIKHAANQTRVYSGEQTAAAVKASLDAAGLAYNDEETSNAYLNEALNGLTEKALLEGWPPAKLQQAKDQAISDTLAQRAINVAYDDPVIADQFLDANADRMDPNKYKELKEGLKGAVLERKATDVVGPIFEPGTSAAAPPRSAAAVAQGHRLIQTASTVMGMDENAQNAALREYMANGGVNLDPAKTAWCAAFVNGTLGHAGVSGTSSNMARSFLDWGNDASADPQVGDVIVLKRGKPPFGHVGFIAGVNEDGSFKVLGGNQGDSVSVSNYSGDKVLGIRRAAGTGSATPGGGAPATSPNLDISSGNDTLGGTAGGDTLSGGDDAALAPTTPPQPSDEQQEPDGHDLSAGLDRIMAIPDPELREAALKQFEQRVKVRDTQEALEREQLMDDAWTRISEGNENPDNIAPEVQTRIGAAGMASLREAYRQKVTGADVTDPATYQHFLDQTLSTDPQVQKEFADTNLNDFAGELSEPALKELKIAQAELRQSRELKQSGQAAEVVYDLDDYIKAADRVKPEFQAIFGKFEPGTETHQTWVNFNKELKKQMRAYADANGRAMPQRELDQVIGGLMMEVTIGGGLFGGRTTIMADVPYRPGDTDVELTVEETDIPFSERERITKVLQQRWERKPTVDEVVDQYEMELLNRAGLRPELEVEDIPDDLVKSIRSDHPNGISDEEIIRLYTDMMTSPLTR